MVLAGESKGEDGVSELVICMGGMRVVQIADRQAPWQALKGGQRYRYCALLSLAQLASCHELRYR